MSKYWLVLALFGAVGCSDRAVDGAGSSQDSVKEGSSGDKGTTDASGGDKGSTDSNGGDKGDPKGTAGGTTKPADCSGELDALSKEISALVDKFDALKSSCTTTTPDPCAELLAKTQAALDAAIKSGDSKLIAALKEKYAALASSCVPGKDPGKPDPSKDPSKDGGTGYPDKGDGTKDPDTKDPGKGDPGTVPPTKDDPCAAALDAVTAYLDDATKSGDTNQIIAAKNKYTAVVNGCSLAGTEAPPKK